MKHPVISLSVLVGLFAAAVAAYCGVIDGHPIQVFISSAGVVLMSYAFVDIQMKGGSK